MRMEWETGKNKWINESTGRVSLCRHEVEITIWEPLLHSETFNIFNTTLRFSNPCVSPFLVQWTVEEIEINLYSFFSSFLLFSSILYFVDVS